MKHIKVILFDEIKRTIVEHDNFPDGEILLHSSNDEGFIDILLEVDELILDQKIYRITARRFSLDKIALYINIKPLD